VWPLAKAAYSTALRLDRVSVAGDDPSSFPILPGFSATKRASAASSSPLGTVARVLPISNCEAPLSFFSAPVRACGFSVRLSNWVGAVRRSVRKALGLPPRRGRRWNKKTNKVGKPYWTAACRECDRGLIISPVPEGYVLKTIAEGTFTEIRTTYTVRGAKRSAEQYVKQARKGVTQ
jgi:hypothetical protein